MRWMPPFRLLHVCVPAAALVACGEDLVLPNSPDAENRRPRLTVVSGADQEGTVGAPLNDPVVVRVIGPEAVPIPGVRVAFEITGGGKPGSVDPDTAVSDAEGRARTTWTLGPVAGLQTLEARAVTQNAGAESVVLVRAAAKAAAPDTLRPVGETSFTGRRRQPLSDSLVVRVADRFGNPVPGAEVRWNVRQGGGEVSASRTPTGEDGRAAVQWTLGNRFGRQEVTATLGEVAGSPVVFQATAF